MVIGATCARRMVVGAIEVMAPSGPCDYSEPLSQAAIQEDAMRKTMPLRERFEAKFVRGADDECWLWTAATKGDGYGVIGIGRRSEGLVRAHRLSYEFYMGPIPDGLCVLHHCDVPACVNPSHLFLGTDADNHADMTRKGRNPTPPIGIGENNGQAKLTGRQVLEIRELKGRLSQRKIGERYGVHYTMIGLIHRRQKWTHI